MEKKYEMTDETLEWEGHTLHRIKALRDFADVEVGNTGGFVESEENLSHEGNCWIWHEAKVYEEASVYEDAIVSGCAKIFGTAMVFGNAKITDNASVYGDAQIFEDADIFESPKIFEYARISGNAQVFGDSKVYGNVWINENSRVYDYAKVYGSAEVCGYACVGENAIIRGTAKIYGSAIIDNAGYIRNNYDYLVVGPIGSRRAFTTFYKTKEESIMAATGCFCGTLEEFEKAVEQTHKNNTIMFKEYMDTIEYVKKIKNIQTK